MDGFQQVWQFTIFIIFLRSGPAVFGPINPMEVRTLTRWWGWYSRQEYQWFQKGLSISIFRPIWQVRTCNDTIVPFFAFQCLNYLTQWWDHYGKTVFMWDNYSGFKFTAILFLWSAQQAVHPPPNDKLLTALLLLKCQYIHLLACWSSMLDKAFWEETLQLTDQLSQQSWLQHLLMCMLHFFLLLKEISSPPQLSTKSTRSLKLIVWTIWWRARKCVQRRRDLIAALFFSLSLSCTCYSWWAIEPLSNAAAVVVSTWQAWMCPSYSFIFVTAFLQLLNGLVAHVPPVLVFAFAHFLQCLQKPPWRSSSYSRHWNSLSHFLR